MPSCEIKLLFKDETEPVVLRDMDLIKEIPLIVRSVLVQNPNWEAEDTVIEDVLEIRSFNKEAAEFLFEYVRKFVPPDEVEDPSIPQNFIEADGKTLDELKDIIELASFLECINFMHSIAFVIAAKLDPLPVGSIAEYFGLECDDNLKLIDRTNGWVHEPVAAVEPVEKMV